MLCYSDNSLGSGVGLVKTEGFVGFIEFIEFGEIGGDSLRRMEIHRDSLGFVAFVALKIANSLESRVPLVKTQRDD